MAYNSFYPNLYPNYAQQMQMQQIQQMQQMQPQMQAQTQPQIQNGGFISVRSEEEARNYPVAPGTSVTFIDENCQRVYAKTMGFSQLDRPTFYKYRLVKEDTPDTQNKPTSVTDDKVIEYALKSDLNALQTQLQGLVAEMEEFKKKQPMNNAKKKGDSEQ